MIAAGLGSTVDCSTGGGGFSQFPNFRNIRAPWTWSDQRLTASKAYKILESAKFKQVLFDFQAM